MRASTAHLPTLNDEVAGTRSFDIIDTENIIGILKIRYKIINADYSFIAIDVSFMEGLRENPTKRI